MTERTGGDRLIATSNTGRGTHLAGAPTELPQTPEDLIAEHDADLASGRTWVVRVVGAYGDWMLWGRFGLTRFPYDALKFKTRQDAFQSIASEIARRVERWPHTPLEYRIDELGKPAPGRRNTGIGGRP